MPLPLKAFIVEDSPVILENLVAALHDLAGVEVVGSTADEEGARQALPAAGADLLIVDIFLRQGSGLGVLQQARQLGLPAVVLTNYATAAMRERCAQLGAERVFDKSRELDELMQFCAERAGGVHSA